MHNVDRIQTLYGRLHLAKADYIHCLQALQKLKSDATCDNEDIKELENWKAESRTNVDTLRAMLAKALEEDRSASVPSSVQD